MISLFIPKTCRFGIHKENAIMCKISFIFQHTRYGNKITVMMPKANNQKL